MHDIIEKLRKFNKDRNWGQFHSSENLAKSISIEANEILELFQWGDKVENLDNLKDEIADVLIYTILLSDKYSLDVYELINSKIQKNELKYPIEKSFNNSNKYTKWIK